MLAGLSRFAPRKIVKLQAVLKGVAGFTGGGLVSADTRSDGRRKLKLNLSGIGGVKAEVVIGETPVGAIRCLNGAVSERLDTAQGAPIPEMRAGDRIEIRQNGVTILRGVLAAA